VRTRDAEQFYLLLNKIVSGGLVEVDAVARPTMTLTPSINISSDQTADRRERSKFTRAGTEVAKEQPWRLYGSQVSVLVRNEVRRNLFTRRRIWIYLLAFLPVLMILAHVIFDRNEGAGPGQLENDTQVSRESSNSTIAAGHLLHLHGDLYVAIPR